ncbi:internal virion protein [Enterobacter phage EcpYZU01]|uniref:internal virion protein n=1 Tax=Enterobacter phage EcpYZU01 TaxID=2483604 RepID=UPI0018ACE100|nr:internal virion protein [Enterobacter phage EcpYZU01]
MASNVESALANRTIGRGRAPGKSISVDYQAANVQGQTGDSGLARAFTNFVESGTGMYKQFVETAKDKADERSNEIIRKLTPQQRREAIQNGTLLYQDDPYAMEALRVKTGRNAAFAVDDEINIKIQNGEFRTRQDMEEYRHQRLQDAAQSYAEEAGINPADENFQKGFNDNITDRNVAIYGAFNKYFSKQSENTAMLNTRVEMNSFLNDGDLMRSPEAGKSFMAYLRDGLTTAAIPSDQRAVEVITQTVRDAIQKSGGSNFLQQVRGERITLNGVDATVEEIVGPEVFNAAMVEAQGTEYKLVAKYQEDLSLGVQSAMLQDDPTIGLAQIQKLKAQNNQLQPGEELTPQRQMLINAEASLLEAVKRKSAETAKENTKLIQTQNKQLVIDEVYQRRLAGENVSTNYEDLPVTTATGEFKRSDMNNYAMGKLQQIDNMDIPEAAKDAQKVALLRADTTNGPFRNAYKTLTEDAAGEWQAAVIRGQYDTDKMKRFESLRKAYTQDPSSFAALYPDQAALFTTFDQMDKMGLDPQTMIEADKQAASQSREMRIESDKAWQELKNDSKNKDLSRLPTSLDASARKVWDSWYYRTGNADAATQNTQKWLNENTVTFNSDQQDGKAIGMVSKQQLMIGDNPESWQVGRDIIDTARQQLIKTNPWVVNSQLSVVEQNGSVFLQDATGTIRIKYDKDVVGKLYREQQKQAEDKALKEAERKANQRARIVDTKAQGDKRRADREANVQKRGGLYGDISLEGIANTLIGKE